METNPNLERNKTNCQGIDNLKMLASHSRKIKVLLSFYKQNISILEIYNVLHYSVLIKYEFHWLFLPFAKHLQSTVREFLMYLQRLLTAMENSKISSDY